MDVVELEAKPRAVTGKKVKALRREGILPGVIYGAGVEPTSIELEAKEASRVLSRIGGSTLIDLKLGKQTHTVLVRQIQRHVIRRNPIHVDFLKVAMDEVIRTVVPIELVGEAPAVTDLAGVLVSGISEIEVEALPGDLPDRVTLDLEVLEEIEDSITAGEIFLGEGVKVLTEPSEVIANIVYMMAEEVEEEIVEEELLEGEEPEVLERGRPEEEEGEPEAEEESEENQ